MLVYLPHSNPNSYSPLERLSAFHARLKFCFGAILLENKKKQIEELLGIKRIFVTFGSVFLKLDTSVMTELHS